ncbi:signal peptide peptidase SppA [Rubinisphaera margarita]|uniref:signal peptide peptidase SppA n=1 Tax=Rubinisphaera margarita TaxID=2909586 RepID=UPI001EE8CDEC|nr:signal peptide peptidase SppA [Rubinisphaera margarita]MCG6158431.1 signal peptide peptidase SppA [Rubinisphaera margarita]
MLLKLPSTLCLCLCGLLLTAQIADAQSSRRPARVGSSVVKATAAEKSKDEESEEAATKIRWAEIELSGMLSEGPSLPGLFGEIGQSLTQISDRLDRAAKDDTVDAVVLKITNPLIGLGSVHELRTKILSVRESGKPVHALLETALTTDYLIATACDKIYMPEPGMLLMTGLRAEVSFYKNLFDMLDVEVDVLRVGKYKAAAEPYTRTEMSPEFRQEINDLLDSQYSIICKMIAESRDMSVEDVKKAIDNGPHTSTTAKEYGLIDEIRYADELEDIARDGDEDAEFTLVQRYGKEKVDTNFEGFTGMMKMMNLMMGVDPSKKKSVAPQIAVIYANGSIMSGRGTSGPFGDEIIGSETMVKTIREAAENDRVKAIVLRVNSPGGSAVASDLIWRALEQVDKPVVVSMGDVAASGGYYISMGADHIYAEPGTITGSIGVVGGKLALEGLFEKLGITTSYVTRGENSGALSIMQPFSESERKAMQRTMNEIYEIFVTKAAAGREMDVDELKELAGGRIYTGEVAVENGLVDDLGTLDDAFKKAKELAGLENAKDVDRLLLPKPTSPFEQLFGPLDTEVKQDVATSVVQDLLPAELTAELRRAMIINELSATDPRLLLMPFQLRFK